MRSFTKGINPNLHAFSSPHISYHLFTLSLYFIALLYRFTSYFYFMFLIIL
ncbi:MAG: hypothetical protein BSOLF_1074 [Candidatus Carbobacillus altaicus]|uniref:Uncharacterized protein n=1 Tax=Candidatus Carbonibacillus altaicus TaxID=2163959 RepID=A0A2R6XX72_9BACL|nr:MAG: hypothetical protein BSOLF_1074 [Candidatus Carbobacillus altaicus]